MTPNRMLVKEDPCDDEMEAVIEEPEDNFYLGELVSFDARNGKGLIACETTDAEYGKEVYVHQNVIAKCGANVGDLVHFELHFNSKGQPQAKHTMKLAEKRPPGLYTGILKEYPSNDGFGLVDCEETFALYGDDVALPPALASGFREGQEVMFNVDVGDDGSPVVSDLYHVRVEMREDRGKGGGKGSDWSWNHKPAWGAKPGDWTCVECGDHVFASKDRCRKCGAERPKNEKRAPLRKVPARDRHEKEEGEEQEDATGYGDLDEKDGGFEEACAEETVDDETLEEEVAVEEEEEYAGEGEEVVEEVVDEEVEEVEYFEEEDAGEEKSDEKEYTGEVKSFDLAGCRGFIECEEIRKTFARAVYVHQNMMAKSGVTVGDTVRFFLHLNAVGMPQAKMPMTLVESKQPTEFRGRVKSVSSTSSGLIECDETYELYRRDVLFPPTKSSGYREGQEVFFNVALNGEGMPAVSEVYPTVIEKADFKDEKGKGKGKANDWRCPTCSDLVFGRNDRCRKCATERPQEKNTWTRSSSSWKDNWSHDKGSSGQWGGGSSWSGNSDNNWRESSSGKGSWSTTRSWSREEPWSKSWHEDRGPIRPVNRDVEALKGGIEAVLRGTSSFRGSSRYYGSDGSSSKRGRYE